MATEKNENLKEKNNMKFFDNWFTPKPLTPAQRIKKGDQVSIEEICDYLRETLPEEEQTKFFAEIQLSVYPAVVQRLLGLMDEGKLSDSEFFKQLREQTKNINQIMDKKNETKVS